MITFTDVQRVMADVFEIGLDEIGPDATPDNVDSWDSLRLLNLILAFEQEFGVEVAPDQLQYMMSVPEILRILNAAATA